MKARRASLHEEPVPPAFEPAIGDGRTTEGRYELLESVSYAFLLALEALTPLQRAVLMLRRKPPAGIARATTTTQVIAGSIDRHSDEPW